MPAYPHNPRIKKLTRFTFLSLTARPAKVQTQAGHQHHHHQQIVEEGKFSGSASPDGRRATRNELDDHQGLVWDVGYGSRRRLSSGWEKGMEKRKERVYGLFGEVSGLCVGWERWDGEEGDETRLSVYFFFVRSTE